MLNSKEKKLIAELRRSGRENITNLAKKHNYPKSTLYDLLHKLENIGVIEHRSRVDFSKLGFPIQIFMVVKTIPTQKDKLRAYLTAKKNINSIYTVNQGSNFHIEAIFRNQKEVEDFLEELEEKNQLMQLSVYTVIEKLYTEKFLTEEEHFE